MSYEILPDGEVAFICNGCGQKKISRNTKSLPKGWYISGVMAAPVDPEWRSESEEDQATQLQEVGELIGSHFHSLPCARQNLLIPPVIEKMRKLSIALCVYGKCELIIAGPNSMQAPGRHVSQEGSGSPPPFDFDGRPV